MSEESIKKQEDNQTIDQGGIQKVQEKVITDVIKQTEIVQINLVQQNSAPNLELKQTTQVDSMRQNQENERNKIIREDQEITALIQNAQQSNQLSLQESINSSVLINLIQNEHFDSKNVSQDFSQNPKKQQQQEQFETINEAPENMLIQSNVKAQKIGKGKQIEFKENQQQQEYEDQTINNLSNIRNMIKDSKSGNQKEKHNYQVKIIKQQQQDKQIQFQSSHSAMKQFRKQNSQIHLIPDELYKQYKQILNEVDRINSELQQLRVSFQNQKINKAEYKENTNELYKALQQILYAHIENRIHPEPKTQIGSLLIKNGKFIVAFINASARKQNYRAAIFLKKYLYQLFKDSSSISLESNREENSQQNKNPQYIINNDIIAFRQGLSALIQQEMRQKINQKEQRSKNIIQINFQEHRPHANTSTVAQRDQNSVNNSIASINYTPKEQVTRQLRKRNRMTTDENNIKRVPIPEKIQQSQSVTDLQILDFSEQNYRNNHDNQRHEQKKIDKQNEAKTKKKKNNSVHKSQKKASQASKSKKKSKNSKPSLSPQSLKKINEITQKNEETNNKLGSYYSYKLKVDPKSHHKTLKQVRTSARLSKKKNERLSRQKRNAVKSSRKSKKPKASKSKNKNSKKKQKFYENSDSSFRGDEEKSPIIVYSDDQSIEQIVQVDWIKNHLKQIDYQDVLLYKDFKAMTKNDRQITQFLLSLQQQTEEQFFHSQTQMHSQNFNALKTNKEEKKKQKTIPQAKEEQGPEQQNHQQTVNFQSGSKKKFKIEELPLTIQEVIDPNINNHGIYALLKLSRLSGIQLGTRFTLTRLTDIQMVNRRHILSDIEKAKQIVGPLYQDNLGYIQLNQYIYKMIQQKIKQNKLINKN